MAIEMRLDGMRSHHIDPSTTTLSLIIILFLPLFLSSHLESDDQTCRLLSPRICFIFSWGFRCYNPVIHLFPDGVEIGRWGRHGRYGDASWCSRDPLPYNHRPNDDDIKWRMQEPNFHFQRSEMKKREREKRNPARIILSYHCMRPSSFSWISGVHASSFLSFVSSHPPILFSCCYITSLLFQIIQGRVLLPFCDEEEEDPHMTHCGMSRHNTFYSDHHHDHHGCLKQNRNVR